MNAQLADFSGRLEASSVTIQDHSHADSCSSLFQMSHAGGHSNQPNSSAVFPDLLQSYRSMVAATATAGTCELPLCTSKPLIVMNHKNHWMLPFDPTQCCCKYSSPQSLMLAAGKASASHDTVHASQQSTLSSQYITSSQIQSKSLA